VLLSLTRSDRFLWSESGIYRLHTLDRSSGLRRPAFRLERIVQKLKLLQCFRLSVNARELFGKHQSYVILTRAEIGEFLQRAESLVDLADFVHPVSVLEKVLLGVAVESLFRADQPELVIRGASVRRVAQNLVAQCDRVIEEAAFGVEINSFFVIADCLLAVAEAEVKIADAIVQRHISLFVARPRKIEHLLI